MLRVRYRLQRRRLPRSGAALFARLSSLLSGVDVPERSTGIQRIRPTDPLAVQLVEAAGLRDACDLDLLLFFSGHPRVVLISEQLAAYVGYDLVEVARALDLLLGAGLLCRPPATKYRSSTELASTSRPRGSSTTRGCRG
jgi:hypothetical protein